MKINAIIRGKVNASGCHPDLLYVIDVLVSIRLMLCDLVAKGSKVSLVLLYYNCRIGVDHYSHIRCNAEPGWVGMQGKKISLNTLIKKSMTLIKSISGIRGTIGGKQGNSFSPNDIVNFTASYAYWLKNENSSGNQVIIGRDARLSGELCCSLVSGTLQAMGLNVIDLGLTTTPTLEMAVVKEMAIGGIIVTASHNPKEWNALKLLNKSGEFISAEDIEQILEIASHQNYEYASIDDLGNNTINYTSLDNHIKAIIDLPLVKSNEIRERGFKIAIDAVNSTGGIAAPLLLEKLGVQNIKLINCEPNGEFSHNPEPITENLQELINCMKSGEFDLGIAVDPDVDRLVFVCENGEPFNEENTLVSVAEYILSNQKGSVVSNISSTNALRDVTSQNDCNYYASAVGEVNVVKKMKEVNAIIGGEGNGGIIYPALHYGRDALVGIALMLSYLANSNKTLSEVKDRLPSYFMYKHKFESQSEVNMNEILRLMQLNYPDAHFTTIDGIKVDLDNKNWVHLRKSNTEPVIRIYAESDSYKRAKELALSVSTLIQNQI